MRYFAATALFLILITSSLFAEMKIGYVNSDIILSEYHESKSADIKLRKEYENWEREATEKQGGIRDMRENIQRQSLFLSPDRLQALRKDLADSVANYQSYLQQKFGQEGAAAQRNSQLYQPIVEKINLIIDELAKKENYDFIFDTKDGLVFAKKQYDLTQRILKILNAGN